MSSIRPCCAMAEAVSGRSDGTTRRIAEFVAGLRYEDLPPAVVERARACVLDNLGCAVLGNSLDAPRRMAEVAREAGSAPQAILFGTQHRASVLDAAFINSAAAHVFEFDDVHNRSSLHVASLVVPVTLALAEGGIRVSGRELLTALAAGAEAGLRIGSGVAGALFQRGLHAHAVSGVFAAGLAAAKLLGLDAERIVHAMGHCGSQASGLNAAQAGGDAKSLQSGCAARGGVHAALLARRDSTGIRDVLEASGGFFPALAGQWDAESVTSELGSRWEMMDIGFKPFPVNGAVGAAVESLDRILRAEALQGDEIEEIVAGCSTRTAHHCGAPYQPGGRHAAQMSLAYGLALMATQRAVSARAFLGDRYDDPEVMRLAGRVRVVIEPRFDADEGKHRLASRLTVRARGHVYTAETLVRLGDPRRPMREEDLRRKFIDLAGLALPAASVEGLIERIGTLESLDDCAVLAGLLASPGNGPARIARSA